MRSLGIRLAAAGLVLALVAGCSSADAVPPEPPVVVVAPSEVSAVVATDAPEAPAFSTIDTEGRQVDLADLWATGPVVLVFFATWCSVCVNRQSEFSNLAERYGQVAKVVGILGQEKVPEVQTYLADHAPGFPVILDEQLKIWRDYAVAEPPFVALISKDGHLVKGWPGGAEASEVQAELDQLLSL
ncbi:TlpA family protein disulfide reductase [Nakamurella silvestris]|nr:TlpA family protein disulfide reductase [Nakamurella silvestris]